MQSGNVMFDGNAQMSASWSSLRGYLFADSRSLGKSDKQHYVECDPTWAFENVLARLNSISNQVIFDDGNFDKSSFTVKGTYKGEFFDLYDYKGDKCIHVGGSQQLDVVGLVAELKELISKAEPKPFTCVCSYTYQKYSFP